MTADANRPVGLETERLRLLPFGLNAVEALLNNRSDLESLWGITVPPEWPGPDVEEILPMMRGHLLADPSMGAWTRVMVHTQRREAIGMVGIHGPVNADGSIEYGYNVLPAYQRQGYAYEAVRAFTDWLLGQSGVTTAVAKTDAGNAASIGLLRKLGFREIGMEDGLLKFVLTGR